MALSTEYTVDYHILREFANPQNSLLREQLGLHKLELCRNKQSRNNSISTSKRSSAVFKNDLGSMLPLLCPLQDISQRISALPPWSHFFSHGARLHSGYT